MRRGDEVAVETLLGGGLTPGPNDIGKGAIRGQEREVGDEEGEGWVAVGRADNKVEICVVMTRGNEIVGEIEDKMNRVEGRG